MSPAKERRAGKGCLWPDLLSGTLGLGLAEELTCDPSPRPSPHQMGRGCPSGRVRGRRQAHPVSTGQDVCWYRFLIDIGNEERVVCQNGALERPLDGPATPPYRLRAPTVSPPCPLPTGSGTLSAPFWHSWGCPRRSNAGKNEAETMGFRRKPFGLTFRRAERCLSAVSSQGSSASPSLGGDGSSAFGARHIPSLAQPERSRQLAVHAGRGKWLPASKPAWRRGSVDAPECEGVFILHEHVLACDHGVAVGVGVGRR